MTGQHVSSVGKYTVLVGRHALRNAQLESICFGDSCHEWLTPSSMNVKNSTAVCQKFFRKSCNVFRYAVFSILSKTFEAPPRKDIVVQRITRSYIKTTGLHSQLTGLNESNRECVSESLGAVCSPKLVRRFLKKLLAQGRGINWLQPPLSRRLRVSKCVQ